MTKYGTDHNGELIKPGDLLFGATGGGKRGVSTSYRICTGLTPKGVRTLDIRSNGDISQYSEPILGTRNFIIITPEQYGTEKYNELQSKIKGLFPDGF